MQRARVLTTFHASTEFMGFLVIVTLKVTLQLSKTCQVRPCHS